MKIKVQYGNYIRPKVPRVYRRIMNQILDFTYVALGDVSPVNNRLHLADF